MYCKQGGSATNCAVSLCLDGYVSNLCTCVLVCMCVCVLPHASRQGAAPSKMPLDVRNIHAVPGCMEECWTAPPSVVLLHDSSVTRWTCGASPAVYWLTHSGG